MYTAIVFMLGIFGGYILRDFYLYMKSDQNKNKESEDRVEVNSDKEKEYRPIKEREYRPIYIKIDTNEMGGYSSVVYGRSGTHLTKENRQNFINILHFMIMKESELRSHPFKLLHFNRDK